MYANLNLLNYLEFLCSVFLRNIFLFVFQKRGITGKTAYFFHIFMILGKNPVFELQAVF